MTTVSDLIESTRQHLFTSYRPEYNFLNGALDTSTTSVTLDISPLTGVGRGAILGVDDELLYVRSVSSQVCTVVRGWLGTTAAAHSDDALVEVNPRFPRHTIKTALLDEINSWPTDVFYEDTITLSGVTSSRGYDLTGLGTFYNVSDVLREPYTGETTWRSLSPNFSVQRNLPAASYASTAALFIHADLSSATDLQVIVQKPFVTSTFTDATDVNTTVKLATSMNDIPPFGAAWRLLSTREVKRTFTEAQPEARIAADVPPGYTDQTAARLKRVRDERLIEEAGRLRSKIPLRF